MDLLIDLLIWAIKAMANSGSGKANSPPTPPLASARAQAAVRVAPPTLPRTPQARAAANARAVRPAAWSQVPAKWAVPPAVKPPPQSVTKPAAPMAAMHRADRLSSLRVPMVLSEVLGKPVAL